MSKKNEIPDGAVKLYPRDMGKDWVGCFCCSKNKEEKPLSHNISAFVNSKTEGEEAEGLFKCGVRLDYREHRPNHIQLKIGACSNHLTNLELLYDKMSKNKYITKEMIESSIDPKMNVLCDKLIHEAKCLKKYIMEWRASDYLAHKIPMEEDIKDSYNNIKVDLYNIITTIFADKLDEEADRFRWVELDCGCDKPFLHAKEEYKNEGITDVECKHCGTRFWYHGTWLKKIEKGWEIVWTM